MMQKLLRIFGALGVIMLFGVFPVVAQAATLSFNPSSGTFNKGCVVSIEINLDTQGVQTDGTDAIVLYNPAQLSITTSDIIKGTIYPEFPGNSVDSAAGKIGMSGVSAVSAPFTGTGTFATLKFKVADTLTANAPINLKFDFDPNNKTKTTDTNVVERGTIADVLSSVTDGSYTVGTGTCASSAGAGSSGVGTGAGAGAGSGSGLYGGQGQAGIYDPNATATPSAQYQVYKPNLIDDVVGGKGGLLDNTVAISVVGVILVILGIAGLVVL